MYGNERLVYSINPLDRTACCNIHKATKNYSKLTFGAVNSKQ